MNKKLSFTTTFQLSFLALPLAFVGIPIYLNIADFYARKFALNLAVIGVLLAVIRAFDIIQDPFIGKISDQISAKKNGRRKIIFSAAILLCVGFFAVFNPPEFLSTKLVIIWFALSLLLTYTCLNFTLINFEANLAIVAENDSQRISLNTLKELLGLIGMILAFLLPTIFLDIFQLDSKQSYMLFGLIFSAFMAVALILFYRTKSSQNQFQKNSKIAFRKVFLDKKFIRFLAIFLLNSIAVSLPAANLNFFVGSVLQAPEKLGYFLASYFLSACIFMPLWKKMANRYGMIKSWNLAIAGSIATFALAHFLGAQNSQFFFVICILSGAFLGADLITPPAIIANITSNKKELTSSYFSLWNLSAKLGLLIASSGSLILLGLQNYQPDKVETANNFIIFALYATLPCLLKTAVIFLLLKWKKYETQNS